MDSQSEIDFSSKADRFTKFIDRIPYKLESDGLSRSNYTTNSAVRILRNCVAAHSLIDVLLENESTVFRSLPKYPTDKIGYEYPLVHGWNQVSQSR